MRLTLSWVACAILVFLSSVVSPAFASSVVVETATQAEVKFPDTNILTGLPVSQYVAADTFEDAMAKLDALHNGNENASAANVQFGPCVLKPTPVYLRHPTGRKFVGAKPQTSCSVPVTSIQHSSDLRYKSFIWWKKAGPSFSGGNWGVARYEQRNIAYKCKSREQTDWMGTTAGTIVYLGKTYYARVYFPTRSLSCGG